MKYGFVLPFGDARAWTPVAGKVEDEIETADARPPFNYQTIAPSNYPTNSPTTAIVAQTQSTSAP